MIKRSPQSLGIRSEILAADRELWTELDRLKGTAGNKTLIDRARNRFIAFVDPLLPEIALQADYCDQSYRDILGELNQLHGYGAQDIRSAAVATIMRKSEILGGVSRGLWFASRYVGNSIPFNVKQLRQFGNTATPDEEMALNIGNSLRRDLVKGGFPRFRVSVSGSYMDASERHVSVDMPLFNDDLGRIPNGYVPNREHRVNYRSQPMDGSQYLLDR